jgi:hypothetical protein
MGPPVFKYFPLWTVFRNFLISSGFASIFFGEASVASWQAFSFFQQALISAIISLLAFNSFRLKTFCPTFSLCWPSFLLSWPSSGRREYLERPQTFRHCLLVQPFP